MLFRSLLFTPQLKQRFALSCLHVKGEFLFLLRSVTRNRHPISSLSTKCGTGVRKHDGELGAEGQAQQTSGEPDAAQEQPVQYTDLPLDAEGYPVE